MFQFVNRFCGQSYVNKNFLVPLLTLEVQVSHLKFPMQFFHLRARGAYYIFRLPLC